MLKKYITPLAFIILICLLAYLGSFERWELNLYNTWFKVRGEINPGEDIIIIAIDEKSIEKIGPLAWPRSVHVQLLNNLREAKVVVFDMLFDVPGESGPDTEFARAVKQNGHVVLASSFRYESEGGQWYQKLLSPVKPLAAGCAGIGFINMPEDIDGVIRHTTAVDTNTFKKPYPSLSLAAVLACDGLNPNALSLSEPGVLLAGSRSLPLESNNQMLINFWGGANTFKTISYSDVLAGNFSPQDFKDKIVLIGNTSPLVKDDFRTPFSSSNLVLSGKLPTPGVEVHASAIKTILDGVPFHRATAPANLAVLFFAGLFTAAALTWRGPWKGLALVIPIAAVLAVAVYLLWLKYHLWLNLAAPGTMILLLYTSMTLQDYIASEMERRRTRTMFGRYVSPAVMEELLKNPDLASLGGQRREVTILFADIRGFTSYSENKQPEEVVARLNTYLDKMTGVIFNYGGTLDKYLGDGLMAVFGVPLPLDHHANRAVSCAIEIQREVGILNKEWQSRGQQPLQTGIGINSGSVLVGNVGSHERMDYTVIGEDVNLASRLESLNKEYNSNIIISGQTREMLVEGESSGIFLHDLGQAQVRGLAKPVQIYSVTAGNNMEGAE
jgi:adenylate cyclase